jgi:hypothetical protein
MARIYIYWQMLSRDAGQKPTANAFIPDPEIEEF